MRNAHDKRLLRCGTPLHGSNCHNKHLQGNTTCRNIHRNSRFSSDIAALWIEFRSAPPTWSIHIRTLKASRYNIFLESDISTNIRIINMKLSTRYIVLTCYMTFVAISRNSILSKINSKSPFLLSNQHPVSTSSWQLPFPVLWNSK